MTLALAAKFKDGTLYATDSALTAGTRQTMTRGKWFEDERHVHLYSGSLWYAQELTHREGDIRSRLKELYEEHKDDDDVSDSSTNLVSISRGSGDITYWEYTGAYVDCGDFGGCGSGATMGLALLELIYSKGRSERWLTDWFHRIFDVVQKYDPGVYGPVRFGKVEHGA